MTDPSSPQGTAIAGQPVDFPSAKVFEFLFSQPFHNQSDFVPDQQRVPIVDDERPVFVDEATGEQSLSPFMYETKDNRSINLLTGTPIRPRSYSRAIER